MPHAPRRGRACGDGLRLVRLGGAPLRQGHRDHPIEIELERDFLDEAEAPRIGDHLDAAALLAIAHIHAQGLGYPRALDEDRAAGGVGDELERLLGHEKDVARGVADFDDAGLRTELDLPLIEGAAVVAQGPIGGGGHLEGRVGDDVAPGHGGGPPVRRSVESDADRPLGGGQSW